MTLLERMCVRQQLCCLHEKSVKVAAFSLLDSGILSRISSFLPQLLPSALLFSRHVPPSRDVSSLPRLVVVPLYSLQYTPLTMDCNALFPRVSRLCIDTWPQTIYS